MAELVLVTALAMLGPVLVWCSPRAGQS